LKPKWHNTRNYPLNIIDEVRNPVNFNPLILNFIPDATTSIAILIAMGIMTFSAGLKTYESFKRY